MTKRPSDFLLWIMILSINLLCSGFVSAQKDIVIDEGLAANSSELKVKLGIFLYAYARIANFSFGEYAVSSSKTGWKKSSSTVSLFNSKNESNQKFSFIIKDEEGGSAHVNAAENVKVQALRELQLTSNVYIGSNIIKQESLSFVAFIKMNQDTTDSWSLSLDEAFVRTMGQAYEAFLNNGERTIWIFPVSSNKYGTDTRDQPALGYEFVEDGVAKASVQYDGGGGAPGINKKIVWLSKDLDAEMKLVLAAAMTALIKLKSPN
ncbi:hypothetical protein BH09BAC3_BH09BAC3_20360 [soil metagenome]